MKNPYAPPRPSSRFLKQTRGLAGLSLFLPVAVFFFNSQALKTVRLELGPAVTLAVLGLEVLIYIGALACGVVALRRVRRARERGLRALSWTGIAFNAIALTALAGTFGYSAFQERDRVFQTPDFWLEVTASGDWTRSYTNPEADLQIVSEELDAACLIANDQPADLRTTELDDFAYEARQRLASSTGRLVLYNRGRGRSSTLSGFQALEYELGFEARGGNFRGLHVAAKTPWRVHQVLCFTEASRFDENRSALEAVLGAVKIKAPEI